MIKILYFGKLRESLQCHEEMLEWSGQDTEALLTFLRSRNQNWAEALSENNIFRVVVNQQIIESALPIPEGAEVAILPPVTGG